MSSSDDLIRNLCARAIAAEEGPEFDAATRELQKALKDHIGGLRRLAVTALTNPENPPTEPHQA